MKKVKLGLLACGGIANKMARAVTGTTNVELYACGSRSLESAQGFAAKYNISKAYGSYEELVNDPDVDLIYVSTPHSHHYQYVKLCLEAGKNVLCEKPFTTSAGQAEELFALAKSKGLFLMEALWSRFLTAAKELKKMIEAGEIGEVLTAHMMYGQDLRHVPRLMQADLAGGALLDLSIYCVTFTDMFMGSDIKNISSTARVENGIDQFHMILLDYGNGKTASIGSSCIAAMDNHCYIMGSEGYVVIDGFGGMTGFTVVKGSKSVTYNFPNILRGNGFEHELQEAADCVLAGRLESELYPGSKTIFQMGLLDRIRAQWGMVYPFER